MGQFFDKYPTIEYDFLSNGKSQQIPDLFRQVRENQTRLNPALAYRWITVGERRPDQLSYDLYGTTVYHWTFFIINEHLYVGDRAWPFAQFPLESYINEKYNYYTIRLYRDAADHIDYNRIDDRFQCGSRLIGTQSSAVGVVVGRDIPMNTLNYTYSTPKQFIEGEEIWGIAEEDWYVNAWEDMYAELYQWDDSKIEEALYYNDLGSIDRIIDKYDIREGINSLHHWNDIERGYWYTNYENIDYVKVPNENITFETNLEHEQTQNFERGKIKVIRPELIERFASEYKRLINQ